MILMIWLLTAKADAIATSDNNLLILHPWEGIQILNAVDALEYILSKKIKAGE